MNEPCEGNRKSLVAETLKLGSISSFKDTFFFKSHLAEPCSLKLAVGLVDQSARILVLDSLPPFGLYPSKCRIWPVYHRHTSNTGLNPSINNTVQPFLRNSNMFRGALTFGVGIYAGIYLSQNYQIPRVDEPKVVWEKIQSLMEQYKKPPPTGDK
ncbi:uncharacterized protein LOC116936437 [Daphnia magna]|uniref:uncharacterized protein LOC116936437 n=1 Tax=Daphnia magna TaxID=35525 RepID=UPI001E1BDAC3|nr:uncharacterized protein LOC116936437 [Daphnia magna]